MRMMIPTRFTIVATASEATTVVVIGTRIDTALTGMARTIATVQVVKETETNL
jgi:hypothetical protein